MIDLIRATLEATHSQPIIDLALSSNDPKIKPLAFPHLAPMRLLQTFLDFPKEEGFRIETNLMFTAEETLNTVKLISENFISDNDLQLRDGSVNFLEKWARTHEIPFVKNPIASWDEGWFSKIMYSGARINYTATYPISKMTLKVSGVFTDIQETECSVREAIVLNP